jgi:hypothetical protein
VLRPVYHDRADMPALHDPRDLAGGHSGNSAHVCTHEAWMSATEPNTVTTQPNPHDPPGRERARPWRRLDTPADCKRFIAFLIRETKSGRIDVKKAAVLGQLALYLIKAIEVSDLAERIARLEGEAAPPSIEDRTIRIYVSRKDDDATTEDATA